MGLKPRPTRTMLFLGWYRSFVQANTNTFIFLGRDRLAGDAKLMTSIFGVGRGSDIAKGDSTILFGVGRSPAHAEGNTQFLGSETQPPSSQPSQMFGWGCGPAQSPVVSGPHPYRIYLSFAPRREPMHGNRKWTRNL